MCFLVCSPEACSYAFWRSIQKILDPFEADSAPVYKTAGSTSGISNVSRTSGKTDDTKVIVSKIKQIDTRVFHLLFYGVIDSREHTYQTHHFLHKAETYFDCLHKRILRTYKSLYCCDVSVLGATGIK